MLSFARRATRWVGRHAFPVIAAAVVITGAAGGGIGYAVAGQHTTTPSPPAASPSSPHSPKGGHAGAAPGGARIVQRALGMLAAETGQSVAGVRGELAAGRSIDAIAGAKAPALESRIIAQVTKLADRAVSAGRITSSAEASLLAVVRTRFEALMAEPGTQLIKDAERALQLLHGKGHGHPAPPPPATSTPAA
ncbi:MAG: hypothetical protein ACRENL_09500 [Candidatus Dormibacteria bacterium]